MPLGSNDRSSHPGSSGANAVCDTESLVSAACDSLTCHDSHLLTSLRCTCDPQLEVLERNRRYCSGCAPCPHPTAPTTILNIQETTTGRFQTKEVRKDGPLGFRWDSTSDLEQTKTLPGLQVFPPSPEADMNKIPDPCGFPRLGSRPRSEAGHASEGTACVLC